MNIKSLIKKKGFWVALSALVIIILQCVGIKVDAPYVNEILSGVCALLVVLGLLTAKEKKEIDDSLEPPDNMDTDNDDKDDDANK